MAIDARDLMHVEDFSRLTLFGKIDKSYHYQTKVHDGYRVTVIVMDPASQLYYQNIQLKVKTTNPSIANIESYSNKHTDVELIGLNVGIFDKRLVFNCEDIIKKPINSKS